MSTVVVYIVKKYNLFSSLYLLGFLFPVFVSFHFSLLSRILVSELVYKCMLTMAGLSGDEHQKKTKQNKTKKRRHIILFLETFI